MKESSSSYYSNYDKGLRREGRRQLILIKKDTNRIFPRSNQTKKKTKENYITH